MIADGTSDRSRRPYVAGALVFTILLVLAPMTATVGTATVFETAAEPAPATLAPAGSPVPISSALPPAPSRSQSSAGLQSGSGISPDAISTTAADDSSFAQTHLPSGATASQPRELPIGQTEFTVAVDLQNPAATNDYLLVENFSDSTFKYVNGSLDLTGTGTASINGTQTEYQRGGQLALDVTGNVSSVAYNLSIGQSGGAIDGILVESPTDLEPTAIEGPAENEDRDTWVGAPPTVEATYAPATVYEGDRVDFDPLIPEATDDNESQITRVEWDFDDDGSPDETIAKDFPQVSLPDVTPGAASHVFSTHGTYTVDLTVYDAAGNTNSTTLTVDVQQGSRFDPDRVDFWNQSAIPLRALTGEAGGRPLVRLPDNSTISVRNTIRNAPNRVNPRAFGSGNRLAVFRLGEQIYFRVLDETTDPNVTDRYDGARIQAVIAHTNRRPTAISDTVSVLESPADRDLRFGVLNETDVGSPIDADAFSTSFRFRAPESGQYFVYLVKIEDGSGFNTTANHLLENDGNATVIGFDTILVQDRSATVSSTTADADPGDPIHFQATTVGEGGPSGPQSQEGGDGEPIGGGSGPGPESNVTHGLILYEQGAHQKGYLDLTLTESDYSQLDRTDIHIARGLTGVNGINTVEPGTSFLGTDIDDGQPSRALTIPGFFDSSAVTTATPDPTTGPMINASITSIADGDPAEVLSVQTKSTWSAGMYNWVYLGVADNGSMIATDRGQVPIGLDNTPTAVISANRTQVTAVEGIVEFDASSSVDPVGSIDEFRWDLDGDGVTDQTTPYYDTSLTHRYVLPGTYNATLTVVDDDGNRDIDNVTITVADRPPISPGHTWPQFHYGDANTGFNASASVPTAPVVEHWNRSATGTESLSPVVANGKVYILNRENLVAYDTATGTMDWFVDLNPPGASFRDRFDLTAAPTYENGRLYVSAYYNDDDGGTFEQVIVVDPRGGAILSRFEAPVSGATGVFDDGIAAPKVHNGTLYSVGQPTDTLHAVNASPASGHPEKWNKSLGDIYQSPPAIGTDSLFVTSKSALYALNPENGSELWSVALGSGYDGAAPTVANGVVYLAGGSGTIIAFDASNGSQVWTGSGSLVDSGSSPAVAGDHVIVPRGTAPLGTPGITGLHRANGTMDWEIETDSRVLGAPAVAGHLGNSPDRTVVFATETGLVYAVDAATGTQRWTHNLTVVAKGDVTNVPVYSSPAVANGTVFLRAGVNTQIAGRGVYALGEARPIGEADGDLVANRSTARMTVETVGFSVTDRTGTEPTSYRWNFGDGDTTTTTTDAVAHLYRGVGHRTVSVTARDRYGRTLFTDTVTVQVVPAGSGELVVEPPFANVSDTRVTYTVTNVSAGITPHTFQWDLSGNGSIDRNTSSNETTIVFPRKLGVVSPTVRVLDAQGEDLFTAEARLEVGDKLPPVVDATMADPVVAGVNFTVDASGSTDNDRIASFSFAIDGKPPRSTTNDTPALSVADAGPHTLTVSATDPSGNTNSTTIPFTAVTPANLTIDLRVRDTSDLDAGQATADVIVENEGNTTVPSARVALDIGEGSPYSYYRYRSQRLIETVTNLAPGGTRTLSFDFGPWASQYVRTYYPTFRLTATADPADAVHESDETDNRDSETTKLNFSDIDANMYLPSATIPAAAETATIEFENDGNVRSPERTATLRIGTLENRTLTIPPLDPYEENRTTVSRSYPVGRHHLTLNVTDDPVEDGNVVTDRIVSEPYTVSVYKILGPGTVQRGQTFHVRAHVRENYETNDLNAILDLPPELELAPASQPTTKQPFYGSAHWRVKAVNETGPNGTTINATASARGRSANGSKSIRVISPRVRVKDTAGANVTDTGTATATLGLRSETTYEHTLSIDTQLGAQGRTLTGLDYLIEYPHGCIEQTASPMLAAIGTDQYYRANPSPGYDESRVENSAAAGVSRLSPRTGDNAQHQNGSWSMYGNTPRGDMYYTSYALYGVGTAANDPELSARSDIAADLGAIDFDETVHWLRDRQRPDGRLANDRNYFQDDFAMTGFVLVTLERAGPFDPAAETDADAIRADATEFLVKTQRPDGSWGNGESNTLSTAVVVLGLERSGNQSAAVQQAIDDGIDYLVQTQRDDGFWTVTRSASWSGTGTKSETTGYALLALNASGLSNTNQTIRDGMQRLVTTYDEDGSFGYTRASAVAIRALLEIGQPTGDPDQTLNIDIGTQATPDLVERTVSVNETDARVSLSLTEDELSTLRSATTGQVTISIDASGSGTVLVGIDNSQLVNEEEYLAATGTGGG